MPQTYLVPTTNGARYVVASNELNQRQKLLLCLLRGDSSESLMNIVGLPDRKTLGALVFKMQHEGWLTGDIKPIRLPREPLSQSLLVLLESLSSQGKGMLADQFGCCIANTGYSKDEADKLAAFIAGLYPVNNRYQFETAAKEPGIDSDKDLGLEISLKYGSTHLSIRHLHIGTRVFHLALAGEVQHEDNNFVNLVTRLIRLCPQGKANA